MEDLQCIPKEHFLFRMNQRNLLKPADFLFLIVLLLTSELSLYAFELEVKCKGLKVRIEIKLYFNNYKKTIYIFFPAIILKMHLPLVLREERQKSLIQS